METSGIVTLGGKPVGGRMAYEPMTWRDLDDFTQGYIEALFFTEECPGIDRDTFELAEHQEAMEQGRAAGSIPGDAGFDDLSPVALASILTDCAAFQSKAAALLQAAYDGESVDYDATQAGRDFWFTRNGHGVGFWDRGLGQVGDDLSELCGWRTPFAEVNPYWQGEKVHLA